MTDIMLLDALRAPISVYDPMALHQLVGRAQQAADRIEADAVEIERLQAERDALLSALVKLSNAYAFIKPPGYSKSDAEKQADAAISAARGKT